MMDDLITQKTDLEIELTALKAENEDLKNQLETEELINQELEASNKLSLDIIREKDDNIVRLSNTIEIYKNNVDDNEVKEKNLVSIIQDLKRQNYTLREELSKTQNSLNIDELINRNVILINIRTISILELRN
jgi:hypothetical protein